MSTLPSPIVTVDWLNEHSSDPDLVIADVRPLDAYLEGHIPGAIHADLSILRLPSSSQATIDAWLERLQSVTNAFGFGPNTTVVFYEDFSGTMSAYGVWLLDAAGFGNGGMLDGGFRAWHEAGLPTATEPSNPVPTAAPIAPATQVIETADGILASLARDTDRTQLVDARTNDEHARGAIPGAVHIDWMSHLDAQGAFKPISELSALYQEAGLDSSEPVASYCAGGIRAANTYVVLKALGFGDARNYAPSWSEWGMRRDVPIER